MWYESTLIEPGADGEFAARVRVPADSPWFDGHFPGAPVLPGIAQLGMARDLLCRALNRRLPVVQVSRVRFKQMIQPDQYLTVSVRVAGQDGHHRFRIANDDGLICSGLMRLGGDGR